MFQIDWREKCSWRFYAFIEFQDECKTYSAAVN